MSLLRTSPASLPSSPVIVSLLAVLPIIVLLRQQTRILREGATFASRIPQIRAGRLHAPDHSRRLQRSRITALGDRPEFGHRVPCRRTRNALSRLVASSLWIVTSLYSIGYMRGLKEHSQTRFLTPSSPISLSATIGVAFRGQPLHPLSLLRNAVAGDLSARDPPSGQGSADRRSYLLDPLCLRTSIGFVLARSHLSFIFKTGEQHGVR